MPGPQPLILIPPSESKATGGDGAPWGPGRAADPGLDKHRRVVLRAAIADGAAARRSRTRPAMERYTGVLYKELDWTSLSSGARRRGDAQVRIVSGLWGLVAPADPIPHYRLKMSTRVGDLGRLATWWRPRLAPVLAERARGALVWDLLPIEHRAALDWSACAPATRIGVRFVDEHDRTVSHWNKLLKGSLVRWLLTTQPSQPCDLASFEHPLGYRFDRASSVLDGPIVTAVLRRQA